MPKIVKVFKDTLDYFSKIERDRTNTIYFSDDLKEIIGVKCDSCNIEVINTDTVSAGIKFIDSNPVLLNFASEIKPGGGVYGGSKAQEEILCCQSDLILYLEKEKGIYPWKDPYTTIYSKDVAFIKNLHFDKLDKTYNMSVISSAMVRARKTKVDSEVIKNKIEKVFLTAIENGHKTIILGAWGCGAFGNNPKLIAQCFKLFVKKYSIYFENIIFAIIQDRNSKGDLIPIFESIILDKPFDTKITSEFEKKKMAKDKSIKKKMRRKIKDLRI
jgi:uncharacterized protein (TIGR02452 family)